MRVWQDGGTEKNVGLIARGLTIKGSWSRNLARMVWFWPNEQVATIFRCIDFRSVVGV